MNWVLTIRVSSGIGWHFHPHLVRHGYSIIGISNQPDQLKAIAKEAQRMIY
ncbi:MAG: hypothetical protein AAGC88_15870 [Bacteroidota bacterium]